MKLAHTAIKNSVLEIQDTDSIKTDIQSYDIGGEMRSTNYGNHEKQID